MPKKIKLKDRVDNSPPVYIPLSENQGRYSEGDEVNTPDGLGVVVDRITESFEDVDGDQVEASSDSPAYAVLVESEDKEIGFYKAEDLESDTIETDVENPEETIEEQTSNCGVTANRFEWPQSWVDSETPARVIALKAFAGMGGSFDGCEREMRGELTGDPADFCADFMDRLVGNPYWRGDSWAPGD